MQTHLPYLPFAEYHFSYKAVDAIKIPPFPGRLLHGAFGSALKANVCAFPDNKPRDTFCEVCEIKKQCAYTNIFKRHYLDQKSTGLQETPSSPFIFKYHQQCFLQYPQNCIFSLKLLIIGQANLQIDYVIDAMKSLGERGISQKKSELVSIKQVRVGGLDVTINTTNDHRAIFQPEIPASPELVTIHFITPYNMNSKAMKKPFDISYWLMGIVRRLSRLQYTYGTQAFTTDFTELKMLCDQVIASDSLLYFYETAQTRKSQSSGILGSIVISLQGAEKLWPWLYLGQWFHNGKKTSNGNGRYSLSV